MLSKVRYSLAFTAVDLEKYQGGTLGNVVVQLNTRANASGNVIATRTIDDVVVGKGATSQTYSGMFSSNGAMCYFLVYWDDTLQFVSQPEEPAMEAKI